MNWFFTLVFFIIMYFQYQLLGNTISFWSGYERKKSIALIIGFIMTFFLLWVTGFFCQLFKTSWSIFFSTSIILILIIDGLCVLYLYKNCQLKNCFKIGPIKELLCNNWFGLLFIAIFTILSMSNELPFLKMNYDDHYYIGKMVNLIESPMLLNEDYYNGALIPLNSFDLIRILNTYELSYSFFATLFHIYVPFFCRVTMTIHNYLLFYLVYRNIAGLVLKKEFVQFSITPFFLFTIPMGYLQEALKLISSYDLWQFQTAIFYGGSIVRTMGFPLLFLFSFPLLKKMEWRKILIVGLFCCTLLSFSSIFIQFFILFLIMMMSIKGIFTIYSGIKEKNAKKGIIGFLFLIFDILIVLLVYHLIPWDVINNEENIRLYDAFLVSEDIWFSKDFILKYLIWPILILLILCKKIYGKLFSLFVMGLYILIDEPMFYGLLLRTCFGFDFVIYRTIAGVQFLLLFSSGLLIIYLIQFFKKGVIITSICSGAVVLGSLGYFGTHMEKFGKYAFLGSGNAKEGWNFSRVLDLNTKMVPEEAYKIGQYFDSLPYGNYCFYTFGLYKENNQLVDTSVFLVTSNRIQTRHRNGFGVPDYYYDVIDHVLYEKDYDNFNQAYALMQEIGIQYVLVSDETIYNRLIGNGGEVIYTIPNNDDPYYFMRIGQGGKI